MPARTGPPTTAWPGGYDSTTLTGPLYQESAGSAAPIDPSNVGGLMDNLGDVLLKDAGALVKGDDVACGAGSATR